jgi:3',5'-cyclic AMP phosphodiesterase CpdA
VRTTALAGLLALVACGAPPGGDADAGIDAATPPYPPWTFAVLPDTQVYLDRYPDVWVAQTQWLADHAAALDLRLIIHVGDVTEWNTPAEWQRAAIGFAELEAVAPLVVVPGNHDYDVSRERASGCRPRGRPTADVRPTPAAVRGRPVDNHYQRLGSTATWLGSLEKPRRRCSISQILDAEPADHVIVVTRTCTTTIAATTGAARGRPVVEPAQQRRHAVAAGHRR